MGTQKKSNSYLKAANRQDLQYSLDSISTLLQKCGSTEFNSFAEQVRNLQYTLKVSHYSKKSLRLLANFLQSLDNRLSNIDYEEAYCNGDFEPTVSISEAYDSGFAHRYDLDFSDDWEPQTEEDYIARDNTELLEGLTGDAQDIIKDILESLSEVLD